MPKRLSDDDQVADPVRARLQGEQASRVAALAGRAAAPSVSPPTKMPPPVEAFVAPQEPSPAPIRARKQEPVADHQHATVTRKARFTPAEAAANEEVLHLLCRLTESKLSESGVTRVLWSLLREAEAELKQFARRGVSLRRPANGPSIEMAAYERDLGRLFLAALKSLER